jgi:hypothetical protein
MPCTGWLAARWRRYMLDALVKTTVGRDILLFTRVDKPALLSAVSDATPADVRSDPEFRGQLVESAVGSHLVNAEAAGLCQVRYWRDRGREVDFVVSDGRGVVAIEVKSGRRRDAMSGLTAFNEAFQPRRRLLVGGDGMPLDSFLETPVSDLLRDG